MGQMTKTIGTTLLNNAVKTVCLLSVLVVILNSPIVKVEAQHTRDRRIGSSNIADGLEREAYYCKGANIILTKNVWQQAAGLCNGAMGKIIDIVYHDDSPPPSLPKCVIVDFDMEYCWFSLFFQIKSECS